MLDLGRTEISVDAAGVEQAVVIGSSMGGQAALDLTLAHPNRVSGLLLIGTAERGAPYPDINEGPTAELDTMIESAENASEIDEVNWLEAWMWLDGPTADEGRVVGAARDLFLEMNGKALRDARLAWLDGVAHLPHLEGDAATLDVIADFVDTLAGGD
jgi:pimeloyl-ACP methyl ester carboxylesterase